MLRRFAPYVYAFPGLLLLLVILGYPIGRGFYLSFYKYNLSTFEPPRLIGLENYEKLVADPLFIDAFQHTIAFVVVSIALEFALGLMIALLLQLDFKGRNLLRGVSLLPWMMAPVVTAFVWSWLLNGTYGIVNYAMMEANLVSKPIAWFTSTNLALPTLIFVDVWQSTPFVMLVLLAGLQNIPESLYEAARIDGAGAVRSFWHITLPLLKPSAAVALLMRTMIALRFFDAVWIITRGGPASSTEVLATYAYKKSMLGFRMGFGSAATTVIFLLAFVMSIGYIRLILRREA
ncbi:carbohydrate ABC transporter permease [Aggregatilinea lenta]|uniref:carbohydrate ABC transporter permease n=1 Tax=Aggregatilinea lenta TaxID=913108 RepID=UPI000E5AFC53|nr:sugar ABC transporter permease [Aggregatilinea lenta]